MHEKDMKAMLRSVGARFAFGDKKTQHWTVPVEVHDSDAFQRVRDGIPFHSLYCHGGNGGLVIYLDKPREAANARAIAAIPELVEALRAVFTWNQAMGIAPTKDDAWGCSAMERARAVLSKIDVDTSAQ